MAKPQAWQNRIVGEGVESPTQLLANPSNWRIHPKHQQDALTAVLDKVGWVQRVIVNKRTQHIVDGHLRVSLAISRNEAEVPVVYVDLSEQEELAVLATIDPLSAMAATDSAKLAELLESVQIDDAALEAVLKSVGETAGLDMGGAVEDAPEVDVDRAEELRVKWGVEYGDLWRIDRHRLACIDSTDEAAVTAFLRGVTVGAVFADPPYGISIVAANVTVGGGEAYDIPFGGVKNKRLGSADAAKPFGSKKVRGSVGGGKLAPVGKYSPVIGDETTATAVKASMLYLNSYPDVPQFWWGGNYYANCLPPSSCWLVWDKENTGNFADAELAWTNIDKAVRIFRHMWNGMLKDSERGVKRVHPTQKPVALAAWCFNEFIPADAIIADPFLGSGISAVAAEQTGRTVYGMEMSPDYIAVTLERLSLMGLTPEREAADG